MKRIPLILSVLFLSACMQTNFDCAALEQIITSNLNQIDSLRHSDGYSDFVIEYEELIDSLNNELLKNFSVLTEQDRFQSCDLNKSTNFSYQLSADKNFCVISWDTRQGGTMIDYTTSVIYKNNKGTFLKTLKYGEPGYEDNCKILFDTLVTLTNNDGRPIYLAYGYGQGSTSLPFRVLKAFMVNDSLIEHFNLFPNNTSELWIQYDYQYWKEGDEILDIQLLNGGSLLKIPVLDTLDRPTGKYYDLTFNGTEYRQQ